MLSVTNVRFSYGSRAILDSVSFECRPGQIIGLVSGSGLGKTTICHLLSAQLQPQTGTISINGRKPCEAVRERRVSLVPQGPANLLPHLNVYANAALPCATALGRLNVRGLSFQHRRAVFKKLQTARIHLAARLRPYQCSGGMLARAMLARALVPRPHLPDLLILDEAFSQLDEITAEGLYADLQTITKSMNMMVIIISHHLSEVCLLCEKVYPLVRDEPSAASRTGTAIEINLPKPRTSDVYSDPDFLRARATVRDALIVGKL